MVPMDSLAAGKAAPEYHHFAGPALAASDLDPAKSSAQVAHLGQVAPLAGLDRRSQMRPHPPFLLDQFNQESGLLPGGLHDDDVVLLHTG